MMSDQLFQCGKCGQLTRLVRESEKLEGGIVHEFAECEKCHGKSTIFYSNKEIRSLLIKQQNTKPGKYRVKLAADIQSKMDGLRKRMEG